MTIHQDLKILAHADHDAPIDGDASVLQLANDVDTLTVQIENVARIELDFPNFTDGRAFSQAYLLRRRRGFQGDIRATGDVLIDQLVQMQRTGFSSAVLKAGVDPADAQRQFARFTGFYQGSTDVHPHFSQVPA